MLSQSAICNLKSAIVGGGSTFKNACASMPAFLTTLSTKEATSMGKVLIANDHAGLAGKTIVKNTLDQMGIEYEDLGTNTEDSVDYPDFAEKVARRVAAGEAERGILICGSGIGISIAANKIHGIRAALAWNEETARLSREHNDANIVAIGGRTTPAETIEQITRTFLTTDFAKGRHVQRIEKISRLEENSNS